MSALDVALLLLTIQGAIGAFDVLYNHEWVARLPSQPKAALELRIHSIRAVLYAFVFAGLAWFDWLGFFSILLAAVLIIEVLLTLWDFVVEDQTRLLSATERIVHTVLAMNGGAYIGLLGYEMVQHWFTEPTALRPVDRGWVSVVLTLYAVGVFLSGLRDGHAAYRLRAVLAAR